MNLKDVIERIAVWEEWRDSYKHYVPKFIEEAKQKQKWEDWDQNIFHEFFIKRNGQCVSSLRQGSFNNAEVESLKGSWDRLAPILKKIAESQNTPLFDEYEKLRQEIFSHTDANKEAAVNRLIAGLQPNLQSTIITYSNLNELYRLLTETGLVEIPDYPYDNWFRANNLMLKAFQDALPGYSSFDMITFPWQVLEYLQENDLNHKPMNIERAELIALLKYKKQIILQGPPGTGKTRLAKEIARDLVTPDFITAEDISRIIKVGQVVESVFDKVPYTVDSISSGAVSLKLSNGNIQSRSFDTIIKAYSNLVENKPLTGGESYQAAVAKYIRDSWNPEGLSKVIQFHPSYSYEDFVRGIVAESNEGKIEYRSVNKVLGEFAREARNNFELSQQENSGGQIEQWVRESFNDFKNQIESEQEQEELTLSGNIKVVEVDEHCFRYRGSHWKNASRLNFTDVRKVIKSVLAGEISLDQSSIPAELSLHAHYRSPYYMALVRNFFSRYVFSKPASRPPYKNYVLIIDEINRANLSSVFGELIYAMEYRGEKVESIYAVDDENEFILPPNLFIIGTMNTADRSVGHIDYAIRRRFAFVDVHSRNLSTELGQEFHSELFEQVSYLFNHDTYLSKEFNAKDVKLGHSYFIDKGSGGSMHIRLKYEIKPVLMEYVKDGILVGEGVEQAINNLIA